mmetsp:Transcript_9497/g.22947  ORF Transcript_9497/g.22947 Transcript_9497/m.22947 type:complete len:218 (-) Transcript_9497:1293-1946(-)
MKGMRWASFSLAAHKVVVALRRRQHLDEPIAVIPVHNRSVASRQQGHFKPRVLRAPLGRPISCKLLHRHQPPSQGHGSASQVYHHGQHLIFTISNIQIHLYIDCYAKEPPRRDRTQQHSRQRSHQRDGFELSPRSDIGARAPRHAQHEHHFLLRAALLQQPVRQGTFARRSRRWRPGGLFVAFLCGEGLVGACQPKEQLLLQTNLLVGDMVLVHLVF